METDLQVEVEQEQGEGMAKVDGNGEAGTAQENDEAEVSGAGHHEG